MVPFSKKQKNKKGFRALHVTLVVGVSGIFVLVATVLTYAQSYRGKILPGVAVGDVSLGGLSRDNAREKLSNAFNEYEAQPVQILIESGVVSSSLAEFGISLDVEETLSRAYSLGRSDQFFGLFALPVFAESRNGMVVARVDEQKLTSSAAELETRYSTPPIEPTIVIIDDVPTIIPGRSGKSVHLDAALNQLQTNIGQFERPVVAASVVADEPTLSAEALKSQTDEMKVMIATPATLTFGKKRYEVSKKQLSAWLEYQARSGTSSGEYVLNAEKSKSFFKKIEDDVWIAPKRTIAYESEAYGEYAYKNAEGRKLNLTRTKRTLLDLLKKKNDRTDEVTTMVAEAIKEYQSVTAPKAKGKVISVDIGKQAAFAHENGKLLYWTRVSTGKGAYKTPTGEWKVYTKTPKQVMAGPGYYLPNVKWVMPYNGDYTLHTAYWHTNFGQPMSHGCTNMSEKDAKWFFDWAEKGTPVVIFDSTKK